MVGFALMFQRLAVALRTAWKDPTFRAVLLSLVTVVAGATVFYRLIEKWSWLDSFYFSAITGLTIGYGDLAPTSAFSKLFTIVYALIAVGLFVALGTAIARALVVHNVEGHEHRRHHHDQGEGAGGSAAESR